MLWRAIVALSVLACLGASPVFAGEVDVVAVEAQQEPDGTWRFDVTVHHEDEGWKHYANGWEIVGPDGQVIDKRPLYHPHLKEQTFTRFKRHIVIPPGVTKVTVRAHDLVHGYGGAEKTVFLVDGKGHAPAASPSAPVASSTAKAPDAAKETTGSDGSPAADGPH